MKSNLDQITVLRAAAPLQLKLAASAVAAGSVEGFASPFGGEPDSYGDVIAPGAYAKTIAQHRAEGTMPLMLWQHDTHRPIGRWTEMREEPRGLFIRGQLNLDTTGGKDAHAHLAAGDVTGLSIGYRASAEGVTFNPDGTSTLTEIDLREVSIVSFPAARSARVTSVKSDPQLKSQADLERLLREGGLPRGAAVKLAAGGWPALFSEDPTPTRSPEIERFLARMKAATAQL